VNADGPEACIAAARLAIAYRSTFNRDVLIDLVGYRRQAQRGDSRASRNPSCAQKVAGHPTVREQFARRLVASGIVAAATPDAQVSTA
jgi:2-oxoglutarate dehydrogenase E1 component